MIRRVAVTGASGRLGRHVVAALGASREVVAIDRQGHPARATIVVDILDLAGLTRAIAGCEAVIHLAALDASVEASEEAFVATNVLGTWNVLKAAETNGIGRAVVCSSVVSLGLMPGVPPQSLPIPVDHPLRPTEAYAVSKQAGEAIAAAFARRGPMRVACLRPCFIAFPELVPAVAYHSALSDGLAPTGPVPPLGEPLTRTRAVVDPDDVARAFVAALDADTGSFATFFVTGADTMSARPTIKLFGDLFGITPEVTDPALYEHLPTATPFDLGPTKAALGWRPTTGWAEMKRKAGVAQTDGRFLQ